MTCAVPGCSSLSVTEPSGVEVEEVIWQVKFKSWENLPQEASAAVEAAHQEGRADSGIYQQRRSKTRWDDYRINFSTMQQTNLISGTTRGARRQIVASDWRPTEVTTERGGVWREPGEDTIADEEPAAKGQNGMKREAIEDTRQHQHKKGNKMMRMQHEDDDRDG